MMKGDELDPKGLIADAYRIDGITVEECRSIFLDWALSVPVDVDSKALIGALLLRNQDQPDGHPMTEVLTQGLAASDKPKRRGGFMRHRQATS